MDLGKAIKLCRTQRDLNQSSLAKLSGISVAYLSLLENGKRDPTFSTIESIADALNVPIYILIFLASNQGDLFGIDTELKEKLSYATLRLVEK